MANVSPLPDKERCSRYKVDICGPNFRAPGLVLDRHHRPSRPLRQTQSLTSLIYHQLPCLFVAVASMHTKDTQQQISPHAELKRFHIKWMVGQWSELCSLNQFFTTHSEHPPWHSRPTRDMNKEVTQCRRNKKNPVSGKKKARTISYPASIPGSIDHRVYR
jgi:hypothetical protein